MMMMMMLIWQEDEEGVGGVVRRDHGVDPSKVNTLPGLGKEWGVILMM